MDNIQQQIAEITERGRASIADRQARNEAAAAELEAERLTEERQHIQGLGLPEWMHEYVSARTTEDGWMFMLTLPGFSPVDFNEDNPHRWQRIEVATPRRIVFDDYSDYWRVECSWSAEPSSLVEAIAIAADNGESYWAMKAEADRRNAEGIRPEPKPQPVPEPDMIAQAGELLRTYQAFLEYPKLDDTIVLASAVLAVAAELRAVCNALQDGAA